MEPVTKMTNKKMSAKVERVVLDNEVYTLSEKQLNEFHNKSANTKLNLKQFLNYMLLKRCSSPLSEEEIAELNAKFYDPVLVAKLAYKKALEAKKQGRQYTQDEMMKLYQTQSVNSESALRKIRGRKKKLNNEGGTPDKNESNDKDSTVVESSTNSSLKYQISVTKNEKNEDILPPKSS